MSQKSVNEKESKEAYSLIYILAALVLLALISTGCEKKQELLNESTPFVSGSYPVSEMFGRHTLPEFVQNNCQGVYDQNCELLYIGYFGQKLLEHYHQVHNSVTICQWNLGACMNDRFFEDHVKYWGTTL